MKLDFIKVQKFSRKFQFYKFQISFQYLCNSTDAEIISWVNKQRYYALSFITQKVMNDIFVE